MFTFLIYVPDWLPRKWERGTDVISHLTDLTTNVPLIPIVKLGSLRERRHDSDEQQEVSGLGGDIFSDAVLATAILDRLLHHPTTINIMGRATCTGLST